MEQRRAAEDRRAIMNTSMSVILRDAGSNPVFWLGLAIILVLAIAGYFVFRRGQARPPPVGEGAKVVHDWIPTGRIDFAGPSMDESAANTPASFYLQAEDARFLISFSGIERKEVRWRKATLNEAKKVVNVFHRQVAVEPGRRTDDVLPALQRPANLLAALLIVTIMNNVDPNTFRGSPRNFLRTSARGSRLPI